MSEKFESAPGRFAALIGREREDVQKRFDQLAPVLARLKAPELIADRLLETALVMLRRNPTLARCTERSFLGCLIECAKLGLYPDIRGHVWFIPRQTGPFDQTIGEKAWECHFQPGYQGLLELARRSGQIETIDPRVVYEGDDFDYEFGTTPFVKHRPARTARGELSCCYAIAWLKDARHPQFVVMEKDDVQKRKQVSKGAFKPDSIWTKWPEAMWLKSSLIALCKYLPSSTEQMHRAIALDEISEAEKPQGLDAELDADIESAAEETAHAAEELLPQEESADEGA